MLGSDRCTGRPGWRSVWLFERLGLSVWQDLPSHDGWWLERRQEREARKENNYINTMGVCKMPTYEMIWDAQYLTRVEGIKSNLITGAQLAFIFLLLSENPPSRESTNLQKKQMNGSIKSTVVCSWLCSIWPFYEPSGIVNRKQKRGNVFLKQCTDDSICL